MSDYTSPNGFDREDCELTDSLWRRRVVFDCSLEDLKKDVITTNMLRRPSVMRAHDSIKLIMADLMKALAMKTDLQYNLSTFDLVDMKLDVTKDDNICLKQFKHPVENFLHTLSQNGFRFWNSGCFLSKDVPSNCTVIFEHALWKLSVTHPSTARRHLWLNCILAYLMASVIDCYRDIAAFADPAPTTTPVVFEMSDPKQAIEDTMPEVEVEKVAQNTSITQEVDDSVNVHVSNGTMLQEIATTEELVRVPGLAERFVRVFDTSQSLSVTDTPNLLKFEIDVPNGLYSFFDSTIVSALRSFTLIRADVEFLIKFNANQAQCGRYIVASYPCRNQCPIPTFNVKDNVWRMLQRDHAIVDVSSSNDVNLLVVFENLRPWLPIQTDEVGTLTGGSFATVVMRCLSSVRVVDTGNPTVPYQVFARLKNAYTTGMRFPTSISPTNAISFTETLETTPVAFEMSNAKLDSTLKSINTTCKVIPIFGPLFGLTEKIIGNASLSVAKVCNVNQDKIKEVESRLNYIGVTNKDRPIDITYPSPLLPTPIHALSHGRTPYAGKRMRLEPEATTAHVADHSTVNDICSISKMCQIPGYVGSFELTVANTQGQLMIELPAIPYDPRYASLYPALSNSVTQFPPVTYAYQVFNFYAGALIYEFVPVKTASHNFSLQVGFIPFNGVPGEVTEAQLQSCKWKALDFRTAENSSFTVPWLSPSVMRTGPVAQSSYFSARTDLAFPTSSRLDNTFLSIKDSGKVVVRLVNELNVTPFVSQSIEVLVFVKAHPNFRYHSPTSLRAPLHYIPSLETFTRENPAIAGNKGVAIIPRAFLGNFDFTAIAYEMSGPVQMGDEQTLPGDDLRDALGPQLQSLESHDNILDVCRRTYFHVTLDGLFTVKDGTTLPLPSYACVPISPYSIYVHHALLAGNLARTTPLATPRDALLSCFRWMRGSMGLVIHSLTDFPLEVTYLPPVDFPYALSANHVNSAIAVDNNIPLFALPQSVGQPTEIIEPRVNPLLAVEIPFYNQNNYIDLQSMLIPLGQDLRFTYDQTRLNFADFSANYLGNLVVRGLNSNVFLNTSELINANSFRVRISSSLGDDCTLHHFMGVPPMTTQSPTLRYNVVSATTAFRDRNRTRQEIETSLIASGIESNPGPVQGFFPNLGLGISNSFTTTKNLMHDLRELVKSPREITNQINDLKLRGASLVDQITTMLAAYTTGIDVLELGTLAFSILSALNKNTNIYATFSVICQILKLTGVFHADAVAAAMTRLSLIFNNFEKKEEKLSHEMDSDTISSMASVFSSIILETYFAYSSVDKTKVNIDESYVKQVFLKTFKNFNIMRSGALCILMSRLCSAIRVLWSTARKWIRGLEKHDILSDDPEFIRGFMIDYEFFMDERNLSGQSLIQRHRDRFWTTVLTAYYLKSILATVDRKYVNLTLSTAVKEIITKANQLKSHMTAPPVRYEPYSLWFWGDPGTGKTTLMQQLTIDMAKNIGVIRNGDPIYVRSPHSVWWNGYDGEPITMIDDANGVTDPTILGRMVSEFQAIKTSAKMRIEMPRLEEKNAEMTSVILGVCSNVSEWMSSMILDKSAFRRRRDMLVRVCWSPLAETWFEGNPASPRIASVLPKAMTSANKHISFQVSSNPATNDLNGIIYDYEAFTTQLLNHHKSYHDCEVEKMFARYEKSLQLASQASENIMDKQTLKTALIAVLMGCESTEVMAETMKRQLYEIKSQSPERYKQLPIHTRNILDKMSSSIAHEAPAVANEREMQIVRPHMSAWFKNTLFPSYDVGSGFIADLAQEFKPWKYEEQRTFEMDLITTSCCACQRNHSIARHAVYICPKSVADNQHWVCSECQPNFEQAGNLHCPVCRCDSLVTVQPNQHAWRLHTRCLHIIKTLTKRITQPIVVTFEVLWRNAIVVSYASMMAIMSYSIIRNCITIAKEKTMYQSDLELFIRQYGLLPDKYDVLNDSCVFSVRDAVFIKNEEGDFMRSNPSVIYEAKNSKKTPELETMKTVLEIGQTGNILNIEEVPSTSRQSIASSSGSEGFRSPVNEDFDILEHVPSIKCSLDHAEHECTPHLKDGKKLYVFFDDNHFILNTREPGKEAFTYQIPNTKCENRKCKMNLSLERISTLYYEQRIDQWLGRQENGLDIFPKDFESVPPNIQTSFNEMYPAINPPVEETLYRQMIEWQKVLIKNLRGKILSWIEVIYDQMCQRWFAITSCIAICFALYFGIKYYYSEEEGVTLEPTFESSQPRETGKGRKSVLPNTRLYVKPQSTAAHEMKMSINTKLPDNVKNISELILRNKFCIKCAGFEVCGLIIMNNVGLLPRHAFNFLSHLQNKSEPIVITNSDGAIFMLEQNIGMHCIEDNIRGEYVLFQHKRLTGKDIRHHFFTTIHDDIVYPPYAYGVDLQDGKVLPVSVLSVNQHSDDEAPEIKTTWNCKDQDYTYTSKMYAYLTVEGFRGRGKCGSPLISAEGKIIAIHFAGQLLEGIQIGYSAPVFKESFAGAAIQAIEPVNVTHEMAEFPNLKYYSHYPNPPYHTEKSKIQPSAIAEEAWDSCTFPCIQTSKDPRYKYDSTPLLDGASTIGAYTVSPDQYILKSAVGAVAQEMIKHMPTPSMPAPVSIHEAVTASNHTFVESMNLATSAGLPWIADFPRRNLKSDYISHFITKEGDHKVKLADVFKEKYDMQFASRKHGLPPREPFWAHLKDERRKEEKLMSLGGTRVFSVSPLELVLSSRRALLPIMDAFHSNPVALHHAIGLSPDSTQWTDLIESLRKKSDKIIQLDFSKFSDSMPWEFVYGAFDVIVRYYEQYNMMTQELDNILKTIRFEITQSLLVVGGDIYELVNGVLQGHPITSLINSLVNIIEQVYVWIKITKCSGSDFFRRCGIVVMGDDVVISVPKRFLAVYNGQTIAGAFADMKIVVTDETKNKDYVQPFQNINRFDFLSCSYMLHPYRKLYLAPSDPASIYDTALWIRRKDGPFFDATEENVNQSLMNSFGHGPCIYEMYRGMLEFLTKKQFRTWFDLDYIFYNDAGLRRSVVTTNHGVITGTSPKWIDSLGASVGRIDEASVEKSHENQYWSVDFLSEVKLDTHGTVAGQYKCICRYDCENELMKRVRQVEQRTGTSRTRFLPFISQEEGTRILGARIKDNRIAKSRGYASTIAFNNYGSVACDSTVGRTDGKRERV
nr:MAG: polyprotein [Iflaviridae sp.]